MCDLEWLVRDSVKDDLDENLLVLSKFLIDNEVDCEGDAIGFLCALQTFLNDIESYTFEELTYVVESIQTSCAIEVALRAGSIEEKHGEINIPLCQIA